jgi:hypothetical protein
MNVSNSIFWRSQPLLARKLRFAEALIYQAPQQDLSARLPRRSPWLAEALRRWLGEGGSRRASPPKATPPR